MIFLYRDVRRPTSDAPVRQTLFDAPGVIPVVVMSPSAKAEKHVFDSWVTARKSLSSDAVTIAGVITRNGAHFLRRPGGTFLKMPDDRAALMNAMKHLRAKQAIDGLPEALLDSVAVASYEARWDATTQSCALEFYTELNGICSTVVLIGNPPPDQDQTSAPRRHHQDGHHRGHIDASSDAKKAFTRIIDGVLANVDILTNIVVNAYWAQWMRVHPLELVRKIEAVAPPATSGKPGETQLGGAILSPQEVLRRVGQRVGKLLDEVAYAFSASHLVVFVPNTGLQKIGVLATHGFHEADNAFIDETLLRGLTGQLFSKSKQIRRSDERFYGFATPDDYHRFRQNAKMGAIRTSELSGLETKQIGIAALPDQAGAFPRAYTHSTLPGLWSEEHPVDVEALCVLRVHGRTWHFLDHPNRPPPAFCWRELRALREQNDLLAMVIARLATADEYNVGCMLIQQLSYALRDRELDGFILDLRMAFGAKGAFVVRWEKSRLVMLHQSLDDAELTAPSEEIQRQITEPVRLQGNSDVTFGRVTIGQKSVSFLCCQVVQGRGGLPAIFLVLLDVPGEMRIVKAQRGADGDAPTTASTGPFVSSMLVVRRLRWIVPILRAVVDRPLSPPSDPRPPPSAAPPAETSAEARQETEEDRQNFRENWGMMVVLAEKTNDPALRDDIRKWSIRAAHHWKKLQELTRCLNKGTTAVSGEFKAMYTWGMKGISKPFPDAMKQPRLKASDSQKPPLVDLNDCASEIIRRSDNAGATPP